MKTQKPEITTHKYIIFLCDMTYEKKEKEKKDGKNAHREIVFDLLIEDIHCFLRI